MEMTLLGHGDIPTRFVRDSATGKVKNALPGTMVIVRKCVKSVPKNWIPFFVIFANEKGRRWLFCYFSTVKDIMSWVFTPPPREGLFLSNFLPFT